jgi:hypothetical protein
MTKIKIMQYMLATVIAAMAQIALGGQQADRCMLPKIKNTRSVVAVSSIRNACTKIYNNGRFLPTSERRYYNCLLQNLPGTENDTSAQHISNICGRQGINSLR